ncbi:hypothetical protein [Methylobacterium dankookense]|uniref:Uncharacterized protein n=1 Tax=Methylobacterium dankookense TaxID=560405 RepID=A0A564FR56_9HYPH|nr:hypothetical protein [Methylobacterium dankookense]GJD56091.1 hypothetical protein IFDJLNFL_1985 [Methylobacterium dankookense]VUF10653.1 hypothetical protein MTDSW087_00323 [Methylobacterium dankookense]
MVALLAGLWPGLAGALVLGLGIGALWGWPHRAVPAALGLALAVLAALALSGAVPGRAGLFVESGALMLAAYLAGCALGSLAHGGLHRN